MPKPKSSSIFRLAIAAVAAFALLLAGCGGDDSTTSSESTSPTTTSSESTETSASGPKEEFIAEADAICDQGDQEIQAALIERFGDDPTAQPSKKEQEAFLSEVVAQNYRDQSEAIAELTPPEGDEEQISAILTALGEFADQVEDDPGSVLELTEPPEASQLAQAYGLQSCGS